MSTPAAPGAAETKNVDRRMSLGKYVKRMSSVFKREKPARSNVAAPTATTAAAAAAAAPAAIDVEPHLAKKEQPTAMETATVPAPSAIVPAAPSAPSAPIAPIAPITPTDIAKATPPPTSATQQLDRHAMQQERARALFAKYGLSLDSHDWIAAPTPMPAVQRVEKSIRMRVHRSCHHCGNMYGSEKVCVHCEHKRCKKCPRYPKKKSAGDKDKDKDTAIDAKRRRKTVLTITTRAGNELAYQPTKQRVKRTCHRCETLFVTPSATVCQQCRHVRCTRCPREPAKLQKWPVGYPGDVEANSDSEVEKQLEKFRRTWRKPRQRVRWECEQCHTAFLNASPQCPGCGHERWDKCTRHPLKKTRKEDTFDPKLVAAVEAKLRALDVDSDDPTSGREAV